MNQGEIMSDFDITLNTIKDPNLRYACVGAS